jgi:hypothetical protein
VFSDEQPQFFGDFVLSQAAWFENGCWTYTKVSDVLAFEILRDRGMHNDGDPGETSF